MASEDLRRIAGALSRVWSGGSGPTRNMIQSALMIAGYDGPNEGTKQNLVQDAVVRSDDALARKIIEELIGLLRQSEYLEYGDQGLVDLLKRAVSEAGHELNPAGYIEWRYEIEDIEDEDELDARATSAPSADAPIPSPGSPVESPRVVEVNSPNLALLISSLRRLGMGGARSLIERRRASERTGLQIDDEYDVQDVVEVLLRSLYGDVRNEEWTPSSAGSSSRIDTFLREGRTAVEIKVTRRGRAERDIKKEILVDINDYQTHGGVETLVVAVYDLVGSFTNPLGFEHDLSRQHRDLDVHVVVVPWVGPLRPDGTS